MTPEQARVLMLWNLGKVEMVRGGWVRGMSQSSMVRRRKYLIDTIVDVTQIVEWLKEEDLIGEIMLPEVGKPKPSNLPDATWPGLLDSE